MALLAPRLAVATARCGTRRHRLVLVGPSPVLRGRDRGTRSPRDRHRIVFGPDRPRAFRSRVVQHPGLVAGPAGARLDRRGRPSSGHEPPLPIRHARRPALAPVTWRPQRLVACLVARRSMAARRGLRRCVVVRVPGRTTRGDAAGPRLVTSMGNADGGPARAGMLNTGSPGQLVGTAAVEASTSPVRKTRAPSWASTTTASPSWISPDRSSFARGSWISRWMSRLSGRAP